MVHTPDGKRTPVQATPQQLARVRSGQRVSVTGQWRAAPAAAAAAAAAARPKFAATSIVASGGPVARPPQLTAHPAAAGRHLLQSSIVRSTNQLVAADVPTIFIPSEFRLPGRAVCGRLASLPQAGLGSRRHRMRPLPPGRRSRPLSPPRAPPAPPPASAVAAAASDGSACPGSGPVQATAAQVRSAVFAESNPGGATVGGTFDRCSFGKTKLTAASSRVAEIATIPCNGTE